MRVRSLVLGAVVTGLTAVSFGAPQRSGAPSGAFPPGSPLEDALYKIADEDGTAEDSIGTNGGTDIIWLNQFSVIPGAENIVDISVAYGTPAFPSAIVNGLPVTIMLYEDTNGGSTTDAVLKATLNTTVTNANTNILNTYDIADTVVSGNFLVGALIRNTTAATSGFPAAWDSTPTHSANRSFIGFANPGTLNENNLATMGANYGAIESFDISLSGNWLVRANGVAIPEPASLGLIGLAGAALLRRRVAR